MIVGWWVMSRTSHYTFLGPTNTRISSRDTQNDETAAHKECQRKADLPSKTRKNGHTQFKSSARPCRTQVSIPCGGVAAEERVIVPLRARIGVRGVNQQAQNDFFKQRRRLQIDGLI